MDIRDNPHLTSSIDEMFTYYKPRPDQVPRYEAIRSSAKALAHVILANTQVNPDQTRAINTQREAVMFANAAIALEPNPNQAMDGEYAEPSRALGGAIERDIRGRGLRG